MLSLKLTVLGCSGIYPAPGGACSGYLIDSQDAVVWLDAGPGTLPNLQLHHQLENIDAVVLSHEHLDHWLELPIIYNALKYNEEMEAPLQVYGTTGTKELAKNLLGGELSPTINFQTITHGDDIEIKNQKWHFAQTDHSVETLAARVSVNDSNFAYSADTGANWDPTPITSEADLFLCEATFAGELESKNPNHLTAHQAGELAKHGGAKRLVVTHKAPASSTEECAEEATQTFGGPVEQAEVNAVYSI